MNLPQRISLLARLGEYLLSNTPSWQAAQLKAEQQNGWFTGTFIDHAVQHMARYWLTRPVLDQWTQAEQVPNQQDNPKTVAIVMAGNIPLVGFHDWLCVFLTGHRALIKLSSKDAVLLPHLLEKLQEWEPACASWTQVAERLNGADAYIATGSNNSSRYFSYYFGNHPHIIRKNRTAVALLSGQESASELGALADDVHMYFGMGCRNVTKLYVPFGYDFVPLLQAFKKYAHLSDHHKYKNNYDYHLALQILNKNFYMTNDTILLVEQQSLFAPLAQLHYEFYGHVSETPSNILAQPDLQCLVGEGGLPFGSSQQPMVDTYADGVNTMAFLNKKMLN
ncbi:MAG: acyl-CoA reductase [Sphingomonadales bacterium]